MDGRAKRPGLERNIKQHRVKANPHRNVCIKQIKFCLDPLSLLIAPLVSQRKSWNEFFECRWHLSSELGKQIIPTVVWGWMFEIPTHPCHGWELQGLWDGWDGLGTGKEQCPPGASSPGPQGSFGISPKALTPYLKQPGAAGQDTTAQLVSQAPFPG